MARIPKHGPMNMSTRYELLIDNNSISIAPIDAGKEHGVNLQVGWSNVAKIFAKNLPSPLEIERAIDLIEEEISRTKAVLEPGAQVHAKQASIRQIAATAGLDVPHQTQLSSNAVENLFTRMTMAAYGNSAPEDAEHSSEFFAALIILRELMHHLGINPVVIEMQE